MRAFEVRFLGGPFDGARCRLSTPPPDVLFLPIQPDLPATAPLYALSLAACSGAYGLSEYEFDPAAARRSPQPSIVLNYRVRRLLAAWRAAPQVGGLESASGDADFDSPEPVASSSDGLACLDSSAATRWQQFKRLVADRKARLKTWLLAPVAHPLFVSSDVR